MTVTDKLNDALKSDSHLTRWEYKLLPLATKEYETRLQHLGSDGWEAVGMATEAHHLVVLLKRSLTAGRNAGALRETISVSKPSTTTEEEVPAEDYRPESPWRG